MENGFLDLIFFAMIAAFLVYRLRSVLGRRDGHEGGYFDRFRNRPDEDGKPAAPPAASSGSPASSPDNVIRLPDRAPGRDAEDTGPAAEAGAPETALGAGLMRIKLADGRFDHDEFLSGARLAFEMVVGAFAAGDRPTLGSLLAPDVLDNFVDAIDAREAAGETLENTLVGIKTAEAVEAELEGQVAQVTVKFVTEQTNATRDRDGTVIDGDPARVDTITDFWTFARDVRSRDPNWKLVATRSLDS